MKMNWSRNLKAAGVTVLLTAISQNAWGDSSDARSGFNFGAAFQMNDNAGPSLASGAQGSPSQSSGHTSITRPYVGYSFANFLTFGINGTFENYKGSDTISGSNDGESITTNRTSSLTGGGLYTRLLFGQVMFLEAGSGVYERFTNVDTQYVKNLASGGFTGTTQSSKLRADGAGYRFGGGVEIPIANGFYFTAGYFASSYQLKPVNAADGADKSQYFENTHEVTFGLANYYN